MLVQLMHLKHGWLHQAVRYFAANLSGIGSQTKKEVIKRQYFILSYITVTDVELSS